MAVLLSVCLPNVLRCHYGRLLNDYKIKSTYRDFNIVVFFFFFYQLERAMVAEDMLPEKPLPHCIQAKFTLWEFRQSNHRF